MFSYSTVKAATLWSNDLKGSLEIAKPIFKRLRNFNVAHSELQCLRSHRGISNSRNDDTSSFILAQFVFLISELFVHRALLRPLGRSSFRSSTIGPESSTQLNFDATTAVPISVHDEDVLTTVAQAEELAGRVIRFTRDLDSRSFTIFWPSCKSHTTLFAC